MSNLSASDGRTSDMIAIQTSSEAKPQLGISACLLGEPVRYNGGHTQSRFCLNTLSEYFEFKGFCPEVSAGFPTPRPAMRLVGNNQNPTLRWSKGGQEDLTEKLKAGFQQELEATKSLDGYVLMAKSPSCGLHKVKVYDEQRSDKSPGIGRGLYAEALQQRYPDMPMEDEGRLNDPRLRENFILRVYAYYNFKREVLSQPTAKALIDFHRSYKYVLMAHRQSTYRSLGRMLSQAGKCDAQELAQNYLSEFMEGLNKPATPGNHANTLLHLLGYMKKSAPSKVRQDIADTILKYRDGLVPLITPLTLVKHYAVLIGGDYLHSQRYLQPYPEALGLSNRI